MNRSLSAARPQRCCARSSTCLAIALLLAWIALGSSAWSQPILNPVPGPLDVPGKAISDWTITGDQDSTGSPNPHLTRAWQGNGETTDSLDYTRSLVPFQADPAVSLPDVDALGNFQDLLYKRVANDDATLLTSPGDLQFANPGLNEIYFRTDSADGALDGVWAMNSPAIGGANNPPGTDTPPEGIDGLEVWGLKDHNMFSLYGDPDDPSTAAVDKISVFYYDIPNDASMPYIYNEDLRNAIDLQPGEPEIDLDGMMVYDESVSTGVFDGRFSSGDSLLFTVQENQTAGGPFHGGEIWVWDFGNPAVPLNHGGVLWDSANSPGTLFGWTDPAGGIVNEINGLEAIYELPIPEPSSAALLMLFGIAVGGVAQRKR